MTQQHILYSHIFTLTYVNTIQTQINPVGNPAEKCFQCNKALVHLHCVVASFPLFFFWLLRSSVPFFLKVANDVKEELIPEKSEACGESSLQEAGREAFKEASDSFVFGYLNRAVRQAFVGLHLSEVSSGFFEAPHLQPLFKQIKGICEGFTDHSCSTATNQTSHVSS